MKNKLGWIIGIFECIIGFLMFIIAQAEIVTNTDYTWSRPYTQFEAQIILIKWLGIILILSGIIWMALKIYQIVYADKYIKDVTPLMREGGTVKCSNCGLVISANMKVCPRCKIQVRDEKRVENNYIFCSKCGFRIVKGTKFCSKCGNKVM